MKQLHGYKSEDEFVVRQRHECATIAGLCEVLAEIAATDPRGQAIGEEVAVCIGNRPVRVHVVEFDDGTRAIVLSAD